MRDFSSLMVSTLGRFDPKSRATRDAVVIFGLGLVSFVVASVFDLPPLLLQFGLDYTAWEIDDLIFVTFILCFAFVAYGFRRNTDLSREVRARTAAEIEARNLARHDSLTALPNRRYFEEKLAELVDAANADNPFTVMLLDLDGFKTLNDTHGHEAGDMALTEIAGRLADVAGLGCFCARLGGDEFAILMPASGSPDTAVALAEGISAAVAQPLSVDRVTVNLGVSIGIAIAPRDGTRARDLLRRADRALYRGKIGGKSAISLFEAEMDAQFERRARIEHELRKAMESRPGEIAPHYQPLISLDDNRVIGFEALCRWHSKALGMVPPDTFIPIAEETQLINPLGDRLLRQACTDAGGWPTDMMLAFNVSAVQLRDPTFGLRVLTILGETGLDPRRLEIEITETALVENVDIVRSVVGQLRRAGIRVALDDFGTGYATLSQLLSFQIDKIKIDKSFVSKLNLFGNSRIIIRAILALASGFGLTTTAEGVEDRRQLAYLKVQGCSEAQGYLFAKAMPAAEVASFLAGRHDKTSAA
jgi:diguanylate cyclase (GGDEF)-like protein